RAKRGSTAADISDRPCHPMGPQLFALMPQLLGCQVLGQPSLGLFLDIGFDRQHGREPLKHRPEYHAPAPLSYTDKIIHGGILRSATLVAIPKGIAQPTYVKPTRLAAGRGRSRRGRAA